MRPWHSNRELGAAPDGLRGANAIKRPALGRDDRRDSDGDATIAANHRRREDLAVRATRRWARTIEPGALEGLVTADIVARGENAAAAARARVRLHGPIGLGRAGDRSWFGTSESERRGRRFRWCSPATVEPPNGPASETSQRQVGTVPLCEGYGLIPVGSEQGQREPPGLAEQ